MSDWGVITGTIGMMTGIYGAIVAHRSLYHSKDVKLRELRMKLRKDVDTFQAARKELTPLMTSAKTSRERINAPTVGTRSGAQLAFDTQWEKDAAAANSLEVKFAELGLNFSATDPDELERGIADLHRLSIQGIQLKEKYMAALAEDDARRASLRHENAVMAAARASIPLKKTLGE